MRMRSISPIAIALSLQLPLHAQAPGLPGLIPPGAKDLSVPMQIVILMTALTLLPAIVMCITPFLRISIVLHFLRQALGTQSVPSNQVLVGLSLFLSMVLIQPIAGQIYR